MSGSIGANRINRLAVEPTVETYTEQVLKGFPRFSKAGITGSYWAGTKDSHGDIDLVVLIEGDDVKDIKKRFRDYCLEHQFLVPFKAGRNVGKKAQMYGTIVTVESSQSSPGRDTVQIDNIIVNTPEEYEFVTKFLNLDAARQCLISAVVRVINQATVRSFMQKWGIEERELLPNQEYEFVLGQNKLSLRIVTLDDVNREIDRETIWATSDWKYVNTILRAVGVGYTHSYQKALSRAAFYFENDSRARRRILGIINSMINIGPGEVGTPKGKEKYESKRLAEEKLITLFD